VPDTNTFSWRSIGIAIDPSEVKAGTNTVSVRYLGERKRTVVSNINLILVNAADVP